MLTMEPRSNAGAGCIKTSTPRQLLIPEPRDDGGTGRRLGRSQPLPETEAVDPGAAQAATTAAAAVLLQTHAVIVVADAGIEGFAYTCCQGCR